MVPLKDAPEVLEAAKKFHEQDVAKVEAARNGTSNRAWVRKKLEEKRRSLLTGCTGNKQRIPSNISSFRQNMMERNRELWQPHLRNV